MNYTINKRNSVYKISVGIIVLLVGFGNFSCKKIDNLQSNRLATETTNWKTLEDAKANLLSIYGLMRSASVADNGHWLMGDLRQGDFQITNRADLKAIVNGQLNSSYPVINRLTNWRRFYAAINAASLYIERSGEILKLDPRYTELNNRVDVAQARMIRAFAYFYMSRIWGDVPLVTSSHDGDFVQLSRSSQAKVLAFATNELLVAGQIVPFRYGGTDPILPGTYHSNSWTGWNGILFTRLSCYVMLAHIAAWQGNYLDAANYAKFVLDNQASQNKDGSFGLAYLDMASLTENSSNSPFAYKRATLIVGFPFEAGNGLLTANGHLEQLTLASPFIPKTQPEMFVPKDTINKVFTDPFDLRFGIDPVTKSYRTNYFYNYQSEQPIFNKVKAIYTGQTASNVALFSSSMVFSRLEEISLLRAEALAVLGDREGAITALNQATNLRGVTYLSSSKVPVIDAIFAERRRELMGEGWRWYDIIRYNKIKNTNNIFTTKNGVAMTFRQFEAAGGIYWPVSQEVINANPSITQNPYWN
ncbi:RagB/SusD family nutrient uptake outer membrane protein [Pedobacter gandavensis]|uniref:RagB/SusD family nutrient uptake outer membrane protein n=1 Tax=Pedobacter gandavensis TaxID=2679963 RepID=UPI00292D54D7|nr:RagB/SusD family nutrient uptake outer membrane protein [Pedobacter gandavensis]